MSLLDFFSVILFFQGTSQQMEARSPSSALLPPFLREGSATKIDRKKTIGCHLILTSQICRAQEERGKKANIRRPAAWGVLSAAPPGRGALRGAGLGVRAGADASGGVGKNWGAEAERSPFCKLKDGLLFQHQSKGV